MRDAIYRKSLKLSSEARQNMNSGEIINLMSIDSQKIGDLLTYLHMMWSSLLQITICLLSLLNLIGVSAIAGITIMVIILPINAILMRFIQ